jgi:putative ABC transport system permease protein
MLGVILGVASLLSMFSLTAGMAKGMREYMQQVGGIERVGVNNQEVPENQQLIAEISPGRTVKDAEAIERYVPDVSAVTPVSEIGNAAITQGGATLRGQVSGCWPDFVEINKHVIERGRNLTYMDLDDAKRVCVIGTLVVDRLWPDRPNYNPIGETISINGRPFTVVGVFQFYEREEDKRRRELGLKSESGRSSAGRRGGGSPGRGWNPFDRKNLTIIIPISTMFFEFKSANVSGTVDAGPNYKLDGLYFQVKDVQLFHSTLERVTNVLKQTHRGVDDFTFDTREEWFDSIEKNVRNTRMSGGLIAGISLLVGGIGITNIMLASITERIREIGVRRAVGAKGRDIFMQIVVESAVIGFIGGLLGLVASTGMMQLLIMISPAENAPYVELSAVLISFGFAVVIGVLSGLYPAFRASRIEPIEALRYG